MSKQIEEIKEILIKTCKRTRSMQEDYMQDRYAEALCNAGYRKQSEGEWKMLIYNKHCSCGKSQKVARYECSVCKRVADMQPYGLTYCPNCGARMKGGEQG